MNRKLLSVGLDVGTSTTQMVASRLTVENRGSSFSVPELVICHREVCYRGAVQLTPLLGQDRIDGEKLREMILREYTNAGISRGQVDTGAIIITGETSRKENAATVLRALADLAGDFVVATAGPDLESVLAAKGAGATAYSKETGKTILHMDIGGGTSNLALIQEGRIVKTGCLNVGGRLVKVGESGEISYISPVLEGLTHLRLGQKANREDFQKIAKILVQGLEMAAGLRSPTALLEKLWTKEAKNVWTAEGMDVTISFSGGVADCIDRERDWLEFGDLGPILGQEIRKSRLCQGEYRLGEETIRATVIGAGSHSLQLSGSTVFCRNVAFPLKNLPVIGASLEEVWRKEDLRRRMDGVDGDAVLYLEGECRLDYEGLRQLGKQLVAVFAEKPVYVAMKRDTAKALGQIMALQAPQKAILCMDGVTVQGECYMDVAEPVGTAFPIVIKTLVLER